MKKLLMLTLAIVTLINMGYSQNSPIKRGGVIVYEKDGHGLVAAPTDLGGMDWDSAKKACANLVLNGYSDWRLPTREELYQLYLNMDKIGGFTDIDYWSSTEANSYDAWGQYFGGGLQEPSANTSGYEVRAVRSF